MAVEIREQKLTVNHVTVVIDRPYSEVKKEFESKVNKLDNNIRKLLAERKVNELKQAVGTAAGQHGLLTFGS